MANFCPPPYSLWPAVMTHETVQCASFLRKVFHQIITRLASLLILSVLPPSWQVKLSEKGWLKTQRRQWFCITSTKDKPSHSSSVWNCTHFALLLDTLWQPKRSTVVDVVAFSAIGANWQLEKIRCKIVSINRSEKCEVLAYMRLLAITDRNVWSCLCWWQGEKGSSVWKMGVWLKMHSVIIAVEENVKDDLRPGDTVVWQPRTTKYKRYFLLKNREEKSLDSANDASCSKNVDFSWWVWWILTWGIVYRVLTNGGRCWRIRLHHLIGVTVTIVWPSVRIRRRGSCRSTWNLVQFKKY